MGNERATTVRELLLTRRGLAFVSSRGAALPDEQVRAVELDLAGVGYVLSSRLRARLATVTLDELVAFRAWALAALLARVGGGRAHEPLFRGFPEGVPRDTRALWFQKVLVHYLQGEAQPCLFCAGVGTCHVLSPCEHVVCERCFDGASYSACPVCERRVDRGSPFFVPSAPRGQPAERVVFARLELGDDPIEASRELFVSLCERKQPLSPDDRDALTTLVGELGVRVLPWLPRVIAVRENVAMVFGTLFTRCPPTEVLEHARRYMTTATDVLRLVAVVSGQDGSLTPEHVIVTTDTCDVRRFHGKVAQQLAWVRKHQPQASTVRVPLLVSRFRVAKLPRALRRALLGVLEGLDPRQLVEDMMRRRSYWVWLGEHLHPHEYAARFPSVARAFQVVRGKGPDGTPGPAFEGWGSRLGRALREGDDERALQIAAERPGELARRLDALLRGAGTSEARARVVEVFVGKLGQLATPMLVTLRAHLSTRSAKVGVRVYWPKKRITTGLAKPDERPVIERATIEVLTGAIDAELLRRFAAKPAFGDGLIDASLRRVVAPFSERSAARSAVALPRGSRVALPPGKLLRLFLHWCQPASGGTRTDLDLSVAFYDEAWQFVGTCAYYDLTFSTDEAGVVAESSGDRQDGPWPEGATEFVDVNREAAVRAGVRYAVMVVTNYCGMAFDALERGFAGVMLRDDAGGEHFDPRTVELKFAVSGSSGVFLPLLVDVRDGVLHWLDAHQKGEFEFNNVENCRTNLTRLCPDLLAYFASGARASMYDLGLLHLAARCRRVFVRDRGFALFVRGPDETAEAFHARLVQGEADEPRSGPPTGDAPLLALLERGDLDLPTEHAAYALFRERVTPTLAASDLLS